MHIIGRPAPAKIGFRETGENGICAKCCLRKIKVIYSIYIWLMPATVLTGTLVKKDGDTLIVNSDVGTLVDADLGTMIINDTGEDDDDSTMKSKAHVASLTVYSCHYMETQGRTTVNLGSHRHIYVVPKLLQI